MTRVLEKIYVISQENVLKALSTPLSRLNKCVDCEGGHLGDSVFKINGIYAFVLNLHCFVF